MLQLEKTALEIIKSLKLGNVSGDQRDPVEVMIVEERVPLNSAEGIVWLMDKLRESSGDRE